MSYLIPEQIANMTDHLDGISNIKAINKIFKMQDESNLYPINGKFNVTDRAIRKARKYRREYPVYGLEYCLMLNDIISCIVNDPSL